MSLLKPIENGNMYQNYYRWNPIAGCKHGCDYCSIKRIETRVANDMTTPKFREHYLKDNLGSGRKIFVGSSSDSWGEWVPNQWIFDMLEHCRKYPENEYLFLSKNPQRFPYFLNKLPPNTMLGTTLETNRNELIRQHTSDITPRFLGRATAMSHIRRIRPDIKTMLSLEPLMDFDLDDFVDRIEMIGPDKVWVGADSGKNNLPEPSPEKVKSFIQQLAKFTEVVEKKNLVRLLKEDAQ